MRPVDTGSFVPLRSTIVKTSVPSTVTSVFSVREKPGASERVTAWVSWIAWYLRTLVLDLAITVVSSLCPVTCTGCDAASADGASRKLVVARAAAVTSLVRNDIGAVPDLRLSQPGHLTSPPHCECIVLGEMTAPPALRPNRDI